MQLDNDLLDKWLKCRQVADQDIKQMVETIQEQRNEIKELKADIEGLESYAYGSKLEE